MGGKGAVLRRKSGEYMMESKRALMKTITMGFGDCSKLKKNLRRCKKFKKYKIKANCP